MDWFKIGKGVWQDCMLSPCLFNFYEEYIMRNARLDESQAGIKNARRIKQLQICRWYYFNGRKQEELKRLLMRVKEESEKAGLKHNSQKTKIIASGPTSSWQIEGEKWKQWQIIFSWAPKSLWTETEATKLRHLLLGRKAITNLDSILKRRDITLPAKMCIVKVIVFPVVVYGCKSWTIKKAECQRMNASEMFCWRRLLRVPWTARRASQSTLKEINPEYSLESLRLKLKL